MATKISKQLEQEFAKLVEQAEKSIKKSDLEDLADIAITMMKDAASKGVSPIKGRGRFPAYLRAGDPQGYPGKLRKRFPNKKSRPVNLKLTGEFLDDLDSRSNASKESIEVGFFKQKSILKEQGHREGVNNQPERPLIPSKSESLSESIMLALFKKLQVIVNKIK